MTETSLADAYANSQHPMQGPDNPHWQKCRKDFLAGMDALRPTAQSAVSEDVDRVALALYRADFGEIEGWGDTQYQNAYDTEARSPYSGNGFVNRWRKLAKAAIQATPVSERPGPPPGRHGDGAGSYRSVAAHENASRGSAVSARTAPILACRKWLPNG